MVAKVINSTLFEHASIIACNKVSSTRAILIERKWIPPGTFMRDWMS